MDGIAIRSRPLRKTVRTLSALCACLQFAQTIYLEIENHVLINYIY